MGQKPAQGATGNLLTTPGGATISWVGIDKLAQIKAKQYYKGQSLLLAARAMA